MYSWSILRTFSCSLNPRTLVISESLSPTASSIGIFAMFDAAVDSRLRHDFGSAADTLGQHLLRRATLGTNAHARQT